MNNKPLHNEQMLSYDLKSVQALQMQYGTMQDWAKSCLWSVNSIYVIHIMHPPSHKNSL